jgi:DNA-binding GntR family transcriptional regulator
MDQPETVVEYTINALREAIREGRLAQGQRLVVADITKRFGVSNGPVREAIRRLTGEGLVEIVPHRGATVREFGREDLIEIYQVREVLEGLAAGLAAKRIDVGDHRKRFEAVMTGVAEEGGRAYIEHNHAFHELIYEMAGNRRVREQAQQLVLPIYRQRLHNLMNPEQARPSAAEHRRIAAAILAGDAAKAEAEMRKHIRNSGKAILEAIEAPQTAERRRA